MQHLYTYDAFFYPDGECQDSDASEAQEEFELLLPMVITLANRLTSNEDKHKASVWIHKLRAESNQKKLQLRNDYTKLLILVLQDCALAGPFKKCPEGELQPFPGNLDLMGMANEILKEFKGADHGDTPPVTAEASHDWRTYAAVQEIPDFGIQCYFAFSNKDPLPMWENGDKTFFPIHSISLSKKPFSKRSNGKHGRVRLPPNQAMPTTNQRMEECFPVQFEKQPRVSKNVYSAQVPIPNDSFRESQQLAHSMGIFDNSLVRSHVDDELLNGTQGPSRLHQRQTGDMLPLKFERGVHGVKHPQGRHSISGYSRVQPAIPVKTRAIQQGEPFQIPSVVNEEEFVDSLEETGEFSGEEVESPDYSLPIPPWDIRERNLNAWLDSHRENITNYYNSPVQDPNIFGDTRTPYDLVGFMPGIDEDSEMRLQFLDDYHQSEFEEIPPQDQELLQEYWNQWDDPGAMLDEELDDCNMRL